MNKRIQLNRIDRPAIYIVVSETDSTVTYRRHYSKNPRNFITINKKYVTFI